ncbi:MAG: hypothetical protein LQ340_007922, partial [Diploschistes diacapsis]
KKERESEAGARRKGWPGWSPTRLTWESTGQLDALADRPGPGQKALKKDLAKAAAKVDIVAGGAAQNGTAQEEMGKKPTWQWEKLGTVFEGSGRESAGLRGDGVPGSPGVAFADVAGSRRAAHMHVEENGAVWGWGNVC